MNEDAGAPRSGEARASLLAERDALLARVGEIESQLGGGRAGAAREDLHRGWESVLDALPALVALLDGEGRIVGVNDAWRRFGIANDGARDGFLGHDYLSVCDGAHGPFAEEADDAAQGIRAVLTGALADYALEYPCHAPDRQRWFQMLVAPLRHTPGCVVVHIDITDRKLAEDALRLNEARLRAVLDAEPECVKLVSPDGRLISMNPAGLRMVQARDLSEVQGRPIGSLIHPDDHEAYSDLHQRVLAGASGQLEFRMVGLQGGEFWMETHSTPLRHQDGTVEGVLSVTRDISARRAADAHLASLQQLHQNILGSVAEGIHGVDMSGQISFINPAASAILGWAEVDAVGREVHALFHHHRADGSEYPRETCPILQTLRDGTARRVDDEVFFHRDGHAIPIEYVVSPARDAAGSMQGVVVCFRDISQRLAQQVALEQSEERYRLAARATFNAVRDWDLATDELVWSGGLETLLGLTDDYLRSQITFWTDRIHPDDKLRVTDSINKAIAGSKQKWEEEYRFRRPDGSYGLIVDCGFVLRNPEGKGVRMVGGMADVTKMRALEAQLRASQRLEAVGQLTGGLAHDFNNLLTVVLGNAEMLQERLPADTVDRELVDMIMAAALRGSTLTQRLLAFARRQALDAGPLRLGELVRGMRHMMRQALGPHVELVIRSCVDDWVLADDAQLENALLNLCINARDAMPAGGRLALTVSEASLSPPDIDPLTHSNPGQFVCLEVRDTGMGIEPDVLPLVIEPFFTTKQPGKGTGLGLSMVYGFVKQSNGYLDIRSEPGRGTIVSIYLPRVAGPVENGEGEGAQRADIASVEGGHEHLLLVEDDELVRRYAATQLQALGYRVSEACDAAEALHLLERDGCIDLMLTDVMMPGLNGAQLADLARHICPDMPVLFISGYSEDALTEEGRLPDGVMLLNKPYQKVELARRVRQALS